MENFKNTSDKLFSGPGIQLKQRVFDEVNYYNETQTSVFMKDKACERKNRFILGVENFTNNFLLMYLYKYGGYRNSFMVSSSKFMLIN